MKKADVLPPADISIGVNRPVGNAEVKTPAGLSEAQQGDLVPALAMQGGAAESSLQDL